MMQIDAHDALKRLVDENAIEFIKANEKEYEALYNTFLDINNIPMTIGIDLSSTSDMSYIPPTSGLKILHLGER